MTDIDPFNAPAEGPGPEAEDLLVLGAREVLEVLDGAEERVLDAVARAYLAHRRGQSSLPHSSFLRFPGNQVDRIIALPAYLGDEFELAGLKWIASFPGNLEWGMARASAVMVVNSSTTGRAEVVLEASVVSARRTAASAALAARELTRSVEPPTEAGLIGAGPINFETARFLCVAVPSIERLVLNDLDPERGAQLAARVSEELPGVSAEVAPRQDALLERCRLIAFATTAVEPHVDDLSLCPPGTTILHTSLRDLSPEVILAADNVVDDPDHVCRARTSVHLAEQASGGRGFIRCTLADVLLGDEPGRVRPDGITIFSPFGLGVLDLAVAELVLRGARERGLGTPVEGFFPNPDLRRHR